MDTLPAMLSGVEAALDWSDDAPVRLAVGLPDASSPWTARPLVELFTADEQRARTSEGYLRSQIGERLRHRDIRRSESDRSAVLEVDQEDPLTGLRVTTRVEAPAGLPALRVSSTVTNGGEEGVILTGATTLSVGIPTGPGMRLLSARSEWLGEARWAEQELDAVLPDLSLSAHGQDARGKYAQASRGTWSTGGAVPSGTIFDRDTGAALGWQIESAGGWLWELSRLRDGARLTLAGPQDLEHQFALRLEPGASWTTVPAAVVLSPDGSDGAFAELTRYRRWLRAPRAAGRALPLVYNDFMNTLMGNPTTDRVAPLIEHAAAAGADIFCIDAGWYADEPGWWDSVGEWLPSERRFPRGLAEVTDAIRAAGMRVGLWLEPEAVGVRSP
ncbi:alpha-galactosidase [Naasia aerilata]|uniref:Glycosyl hydrolase family 36 N-terminal domain-containing protein n=1 Tax=Naasia aerilata TaxID=1162966 RepID=A0ABM8GBV2_9MICO|nr:alpha-galactosidase [Naasia aerilata]BDZ45716.1 hypothetical protein GCM10025866_16250 [Naasia aerilata]